MFDIEFFQELHGLKKVLSNAPVLNDQARHEAFMALNRARNKTQPIVYNIETTNACNMKCRMCPRTTMMTRPVKTMDLDVYERILNQLRPWYPHEWKQWEDFVEETYGIKSTDMSENHFYLLVIPKVLQLHGYGAPLLDKHLTRRVYLLTCKGIPSYFSCNPANINIDTFTDLMKAGLSYVKFSVESVDDQRHKDIRGEASNFSTAYEKILELLEMKASRYYQTTVVITMLDLGQEDQDVEYEKLKEKFKDHNVYIYLKSQDQQWYDGSAHQTSSVHWSEICHHPWSSMTVKSDGKVAMCMEDYNNEVILGDATKDRLIDIWNGPEYQRFREAHFRDGGNTKCARQCDMELIGSNFDEED